MPLKAYKMKKLYATNKALLSNKNLYPFLIMAILLISTVYSSYGQVRVPFTPRTSSTTPTTTVYNVKGDFTMIGNTNLTLLPPLYTNTANNNNDMQYVDIDGTAVPGNNTFNSSSAFLDFSTENSAIPECSNIIYAGLYWTGRARSGTDDNADGDNNPNTFQVTKNGITKFFDKQKVSIKGPSSASYIPLTANASDIYYPDGIDGNMYSAYTEITDYVIQNGIGDYFVADIATVEGNGGNIGYYGGWGMVVVYENSKMKWRDITVFDGHAYVPSSTTSYDIPVNGFNSVQNGDVNLKLGLMAGEGDVGVSGDYFEIQRQIDGTFQRLSHTGNTTGNFFNSSITNTNRAPNLLNNTGVDIAMFNIDNTGNAIIDNNQTSTVLRYGSTEDTYIIFNVTFSVDAYIPETQGVLTNTSIDGSPPGPGNTTLEPSEDADYAIEIKNTGTEAINNTVITVPIPAAINPTNLNINYNIYPPLTSTTNPNIPFYDPSIGANGSIVWNLGTLPVPANPDVVLADISFSLTVTTDCTVLNDPSFDPNVEVNGNISGVGAISNISFDTPLIQGFQTDGLCQGEPIPTPSIIEIDYVDFINEGPTASNPDPINVECIEDVPAPDVTVVTDEADNQGIPVVAFVGDSSDGNTCPEVITRTYSVTDDCGNSIEVEQTITINPVTVPVVPADDSATVECLDDATQPTAPVVTDVCGNDITPVITQNADPTCEGDKIYTFTYIDCAGNSSVYTFTYTIDLLIFTLPANGIETVDNLADATTPTPPTVNDNCGNSIAPTGPTVSTTPDCQGSVVYTYTYTDCAGNTADWTYTYTIELAPFTVPADDSSTVECLGDATAPTPPTVFDANGDEVVPTMTENTDPICEGDKIYTFTYTDCAGNTADWLYTYTIDIVTAPVVPANGSATVECLDDATQPTAPVVTDVCGNDITPVITQNADPTCEGDKIYTFTYTDCAGNSSVYTFTYTIDIVTAPVVPANDSATVECLDDATQPNAPVVADVCGNSLTAAEPIITDTPNPLTCEITRTYDFTYTDCAGNSSIYTFTYNVIDTTAPVLSLPANVTAECSDDLSPIAFGTATATDNCDPDPVITFNDLTTDGLCPGSFTITRTWIATDVCGNFTEVDQIISTSDTTAPEFVETLPQDFTIECNSVPEPDILTATDNCSSATVEVNDTRTDGNCPNNYVITRVYTATDECGNPNSHVQTITVQDITPPTFVEPLPAVNLVVECDAVPDAETLTATDTCGSASVSVEDVITDGNCENNYTIARTWTATDECGLTTVHTQIITVQDTTPPTFVDTLPGDLTVECDSIPDAGRLTATDNCGDAIVEVNDVRTDGDCPNNYVILRTWTATDACGLMTAHTQTITVQDTTAPVPTSTFDETLNVSCTDVPDAPELEFTDNCSSNVIVVFNETNSFDENVLVDYEIVRTWTVRDACNNEDVYTQTLFVALDEVITEITVEDRCYDDGIVNLNDFTGGLNTNGIWEILEGDMAATLNNDGIFDPSGLELSETFLPEDGGIDYKFRYTTTDSGCISITEITMNINADCVVLPCGENDIEISKALTPNGDLINDFFYISGIDLCGFTAGVKIFNRWGALVFESNSYPLVNAIEKNLSPPSGSWEGNAHKSSIGASGKVPNGTYYYIITLKDSGLNPITGPVYLGTK